MSASRIGVALAAAAAALAGVGVPTAAAQRVVPLPWPPAVLPRTPPLAPPPGAASPVPPLPPHFTGRVATRERIVVGVDGQGTPHSIRVLQRIELRQLGDYVFAVPAPVLSVRPAPGTQAPPGQRENQILWEGFSPGNRVLAAWAELRTAESAGSLPLRVRIETARRSGELEVALTATNVTGATARSFTADADSLSVAQALDRLRIAVRRDVFAEGLSVELRGPRRPVRERVAVPLHVEGSLRIAGARRGAVRISEVLDGIRRPQLRVELRAPTAPGSRAEVELRVRPIGLGSLATPAGGGSWVSALRAGTLERNGRRLLARVIPLELRYARERQYDMFLANPDPTGPSSATYVYRTAVAAPAAQPAGATGGGGTNVVGLIVVGLCLAAAVPVAAVIWAHT